MGKYLIILTALLCFAGNAFAQLARVSGEVFDMESGEPIIGATVRVDGSSKITVTDIDGKFEFSNLTASEKKITVSYVGYENKTVDVKPTLKIYLSMKEELMDELIVVAFGKQKRESFTGAATVVGAAELEKQQVNNPIEALNGRVAGMQMTSSNSPDSGAGSIVIRGVGSLKAGTAPLIVVDGLPFSGYYNDLNPADIESVTVLKDAASNALYGARGANGVIMVTTKNAERGNTKVNVNAKWGVNSDARVKYDYVDNAGEYYEAQYTALKNYYMYKENLPFSAAHVIANQTLGKEPTSGGLGYMVYQVPNNQFLIGENGRLNPNAVLGNRVEYNNQVYTLYPDDWTKEGTRNGFRQEYNVSISGGSDKYTFMGSLGYLENEGVAYNSGLKRTTARLKTTFNPFSFLKIGSNAGYTHSETQGLGYYIFSCLYTIAPVYPVYIRDAEGNIMTDNHGKRYDYGYMDVGLERPVEKEGNPVQDDRLNKYNNNYNTFNMQGFATLDFLKYFHFTVNGSIYVTESRYVSAYNPYYGYTINTGGNTTVGHDRDVDFNTQQLLNYNQNIGDHSIDVLVGHEYTRNANTYLEGSRSGIANYEHNTELNGAIINNTISSYKNMYNVEGYFLRGQYDYKSKYFANLSYRLDGSSNFHPKHRWGNFWSLGAAWILSKEDFWPKNSVVNMLKFKASYGQQGNDKIGSFKYTDTYSLKNSNDRVAFMFSARGNENISWEKVGNFNTGFEFELFNNRLGGSIDYYYRKTTDMLNFFYTPYEIGYSGYYDNVGDMANTGVEIALQASLIQAPHFSWDLDLNATFEKNRVTYIPEKNQSSVKNGHAGYASGFNFIGEGLPVYQWYMKSYAGVDGEGTAMYYKQNADGSLTTTTSFDQASYLLTGDAMPDVYGGFSTNFHIYDFDISANFNYSIGGTKIDSGYAYLMRAPYGAVTGQGLHRDVFKSWTPDNPTSNIPMWYYGDSTSAPICDRFLTDASYLTFRNLQIGYTFPRTVTNRLKMRKLRVYASCENVAYWTKRKGFDPRTSFTQGMSMTEGYAPMRTITGGLQVEF